MENRSKHPGQAPGGSLAAVGECLRTLAQVLETLPDSQPAPCIDEYLQNIPEGAKLIVSVDPIAVRVPEAAKMMGMSPPKVYELAAREDFHGAFKFGGCTLLSVDALREWVRKQCGKGVD